MYLCISIERLLHTLSTSTRQAAAECIVRPALISHRGANVRRIMQIETDSSSVMIWWDTARYLISALRYTDGFLYKIEVWSCMLVQCADEEWHTIIPRIWSKKAQIKLVSTFWLRTQDSCLQSMFTTLLAGAYIRSFWQGTLRTGKYILCSLKYWKLCLDFYFHCE